nr:uncharacterized protein LOC128703307 [Cherax quadricarinatus]
MYREQQENEEENVKEVKTIRSDPYSDAAFVEYNGDQGSVGGPGYKFGDDYLSTHSAGKCSESCASVMSGWRTVVTYHTCGIHDTPRSTRFSDHTCPCVSPPDSTLVVAIFTTRELTRRRSRKPLKASSSSLNTLRTRTGTTR